MRWQTGGGLSSFCMLTRQLELLALMKVSLCIPNGLLKSYAGYHLNYFLRTNTSDWWENKPDGDKPSPLVSHPLTSHHHLSLMSSLWQTHGSFPSTHWNRRSVLPVRLFFCFLTSSLRLAICRTVIDMYKLLRTYCVHSILSSHIHTINTFNQTIHRSEWVCNIPQTMELISYLSKEIQVWRLEKPVQEMPSSFHRISRSSGKLWS